MTKEKFTVHINPDTCKGCALCVTVCPDGLIKQADSLNKKGLAFCVIDDPEGKCKGCCFCARMCPDNCIKIEKNE